jgi:hypothetical protein
MSQLNPILSGHGYTRAFQQSTYPIIKRLLQGFFFMRLVQNSPVPECKKVTTRPTLDSIGHLNTAETEHLVELGHWRHRRQRRHERMRR